MYCSERNGWDFLLYLRKLMTFVRRYEDKERPLTFQQINDVKRHASSAIGLKPMFDVYILHRSQFALTFLTNSLK